MENLKLHKSQENKYSMFLTLAAFLTTKESVVNLISEFKNSFEDFKDVIHQLEEKALRKNTSVAGKTEAKTSHRTELEDALTEVAAGLKAFGSKKKLHDVYAIANQITKSFLEKIRDSELAIQVNKITELTEANAAEISEYGVSSDMTENLKNKKKLYVDAMDNKSVGVSSRSEAGKSLEELFAEAFHIVSNELDSFANNLKSKQYEFYKEYYAARKIKRIGVRHIKTDNIVKVPEEHQ